MSQTQTPTVIETILDILTTKFEAPETTTADTPFDQLGLDSLVLVELAVQLTKTFDVHVHEDELLTAETPAKTAELLTSKGAPA